MWVLVPRDSHAIAATLRATRRRRVARVQELTVTLTRSPILPVPAAFLLTLREFMHVLHQLSRPSVEDMVLARGPVHELHDAAAGAAGLLQGVLAATDATARDAVRADFALHRDGSQLQASLVIMHMASRKAAPQLRCSPEDTRRCRSAHTALANAWFTLRPR